MNPRINALLEGLPATEYERLTAHMELVSLSKGTDLFLMGQIPAYVHYPVGALISMMKDMPDGGVHNRPLVSLLIGNQISSLLDTDI